jgi:DNA repair protein RecO (recombination protein O)
MPKHTSDAIILNTKDYLESDKIVCAFTRTHGVINAIAKGAKRSKRRFSGTLEPFSEVDLFYSFKEGFDLMMIESAQLISANLGIREDLSLLAHASILAEVTMVLSGPHDPTPGAYEHLRDALSCMDKDKQWFSPWSISMLHLFKDFGYGIDIDVLSKNSSPLIIRGKNMPPLSQEALAFIRKGLDISSPVLTRIVLSPWAKKEVEMFLLVLAGRLADNPPKSVGFLAKLLDVDLDGW